MATGGKKALTGRTNLYIEFCIQNTNHAYFTARVTG
jgi:hypothetical protein